VTHAVNVTLGGSGWHYLVALVNLDLAGAGSSLQRLDGTVSSIDGLQVLKATHHVETRFFEGNTAQRTSTKYWPLR
jgi:hypothetical protein